jgi:hypothetical protein
MKNLRILLIIILLASCGSNDKKPIEEKPPLNIIIAIDFDSSRLKDEKLIADDEAIIDYVFGYFTEIQRSKRFDSKDRIVIAPVSFNIGTGNKTFVLDADELLDFRTGGNPGLQRKISNIKQNISDTYKKCQSEKVSSDFYRFFKNELTHCIKNDYTNRLIILSNGTSIIKDEVIPSNYNNRTYIQKDEYLKVLGDKNWEFSRLAQNIELSPVSVNNFQNLDVLMLALKSDDHNENALLKTIWGTWLSKLGFKHSILPTLSDVSLYKERIEDFLNKTSIPEDKITVKNRTNEYVEYINLENKELLQGLVGNYYLVDIRSAETNHLITFNSGKYFINSFSKEYNAPMLEFKNNILEFIKNSSSSINKFKVFVKESADITGNLTFEQKLNPNYQYESIVYFKKRNNSEYQYINEQGVTRIENRTYRNRDLPNLRANFIKDIFQEKYQINDFLGEIGILDGSISQDTTFASRNVKIFLYLTH